MELDLVGRTALVTGASKGIGYGIAENLAKEGVKLHLTARSESGLRVLKNKIEKEYNIEVTIYPLDLKLSSSVKQLANYCKNIDILINNAGDIPSGSVFDIDENKWRDGWDLKVFGYINMCREFYPIIKNNGGGVILNNIGNGGETYDPLYIAGSSGNSSLMSFTKALGSNSLNDNIRVLGVNPGPVDTERIFKILKNRAKKLYNDENKYVDLLSTYPLGRPAKIEEVTDLISFLVSDRAGYISGTIVTVDGGISSRNSII